MPHIHCRRYNLFLCCPAHPYAELGIVRRVRSLLRSKLAHQALDFRFRRMSGQIGLHVRASEREKSPVYEIDRSRRPFDVQQQPLDR